MGWYCRLGDVTSPTSLSKTVVTDRKYNTKECVCMCMGSQLVVIFRGVVSKGSSWGVKLVFSKGLFVQYHRSG